MGIVAGGNQVGGDVGLDACLQAGPAASFDEAKDGHEQCAAPDEHELKHFIEDGRAQASERYVGRDGERRDDDGEGKIPAEHDFHDLGHGEHVDAAHEHGHEGKGYGGDRAGALAEAELQVSRHRVGLADIVERHHDHAQQQHGGDSADPVPVGSEDAILVGRAGPAHQFQRTEIGGNKAESGDPGCHFAPGHEELFTGVGLGLEVKADPDDHGKVDGNDGDVERAQMRQRGRTEEQRRSCCGIEMGGGEGGWEQSVH